MSLTNLAEVADQIQTYWSPRFTKELRESLLLGSLVSKDYEGEIKQGGNTVRVSQVVAPAGELLTIGSNADSFNSEQLQMVKVDIVADQRAVASYKFADLVDLQSQLSQGNPDVINALKYALAKKINDYLYSLISPSTSAPDHIHSGVSAFSATELGLLRKAAGNAKWPQDGQWYGLLNPDYYVDMLAVTALTSTDFGASDAPVIGGQIALPRYGFKMLEDNSRTSKHGLFFHPSFMNMVSQTSASIKISDLHPLGQFGYIMSVDLVFGAKLAYDGNVRHQTVVP